MDIARELASMVLVVAPSVIDLPTSRSAPTYYPPSPDSFYNLTWALNGTDSPGIYTSSQSPDDTVLRGSFTTSLSSDSKMPHVRKREYKVPSAEYELVYIEVIQRHHKRTPYASNTFFKEDISWNCSNEGPYHHARATDFASTGVYWQGQTNTENPFEYTVGPGFINSTCRFPSITRGGLDDSRQHGEDFASVYRDTLKFLPGGDEAKYAFRVTNNDITSQTLGGFAKGVYPDVVEFPAWVQSAAYDSLEPTFCCPAANKLQDAEASNADWVAHLDQSSALRSRFNAVSGIEPNDNAGWSTSWDHSYDNLSAKQCHGKPLPCSINSTSTCVAQQDANEIYRLGNWEYAFRWRGSAASLQLSALKMGPWFRELQAHLKAAAEGTTKLKYLHNFAHDGSVSPVLGVLQIAYPVWPGMGSEVVFELWRNKFAGTHHVRVLWSGQSLATPTPLGVLDRVPLDDFMAYLDNTIPSDIVAACNGE